MNAGPSFGVRMQGPELSHPRPEQRGQPAGFEPVELVQVAPEKTLANGNSAKREATGIEPQAKGPVVARAGAEPGTIGARVAPIKTVVGMGMSTAGLMRPIAGLAAFAGNGQGHSSSESPRIDPAVEKIVFGKVREAESDHSMCSTEWSGAASYFG